MHHAPRRMPVRVASSRRRSVKRQIYQTHEFMHLIRNALVHMQYIIVRAVGVGFVRGVKY